MTETPDTIMKEMDLTPIQSFYNNAHILITGGTGFLGRILIEKLLRSCPTISTIYVMVRNKKNKNIAVRVDELLDDVVFEELRKQCPKFRYKVVGVEGDCCLPTLGMSEQDRQMLIENVNMIFHVAATVRFDEKLNLATAINVRAPRDIVEIALNIKDLKCFMHISTAFSNCEEEIIEEKLYPPPIDGDELLKMIESESEKVLCKKTEVLLGKWPNTYTFTKAVAEHVIAKRARGLPAAIFRPAIVISTYKEPICGWINNVYGPTGICAAAGTGILRTLHCDSSANGNLVPADMCINSLISAAWEVGTNFKKKTKLSEQEAIPVYHYESSNDKPITWGQYMDLNMKHGLDLPPTKAMWYYGLKLHKNKFVYLVTLLLFHLMPAVIVDTILLCIGKQPMMLKVYKKIMKFSDALSYFTIRNFKFQSDHVQKLIHTMSTKDKAIFFCDLKQLDWDTYFKTYIRGVRVYLLQDDLESLPDARVRWKRLKYLDRALKFVSALVAIRVIWGFISYFIGVDWN